MSEITSYTNRCEIELKKWIGSRIKDEDLFKSKEIYRHVLTMGYLVSKATP